MSNLRLIFLIILVSIGFFQCSDEHPVPDVYVNIRIYLTAPQYQELLIPNNSIYIPNEGYRGIIVTNTSGGITGDPFTAYDAACTYDPEVSDAVVEEEDISGTCQVCGSKFSLILNGSVESGPAELPLKNYIVDYNPNQQSLIIHN